MSLIKCPECGKEVSDRSHTCIQCGFPIYEYVQEQKELDASIPHCFKCNSTNINPRGFCNDCGVKQETKNDPDSCPKCGTKLDAMLRVCPKCWYRERDDNNVQSKSYMICPSCWEKNPLGSYECNSCGYNSKTGKTNNKMELKEQHNIVSVQENFEIIPERKTNFNGIYKVSIFGVKEIYCPICGSSDCEYYYEKHVIPGKIKTTYQANLNPLKPFTLINKKEKVVRKEKSYNEKKIMCNKCGWVFR